jgi:phage FluMu gp28-like protein
MGRYLVLWEADESKIPIAPEERKIGWQMATEMTEQYIKDGLVKDYGAFVGQPNGFIIADGTRDDIINMTIKFMPFFRFKVIPIASIDQIKEVIKSIA